MPNWCYNTVTFEHDEPEMIARIMDAIKENQLFNTFLPMPEELRKTVSPGPKNAALEEKYGASDWYTWACDNWGTKWEASVQDADEYDDDHGVQLYFETAWSPPIPFYNRMKELGFRVDASYTEEGMGFAGVYKDGVDLCMDMVDVYDAHQEDKALELIESIEDEDLRIIVNEEYNNWLEMKDSD